LPHHGPEPAGRTPELLVDQHLLEDRVALAAVFDAVVDARKAPIANGLAQCGPACFAQAAVFLHVQFMGLEHLLAELSGFGAELLMFGGKRDVHLAMIPMWVSRCAARDYQGVYGHAAVR
jgi:hypothetical protein